LLLAQACGEDQEQVARAAACKPLHLLQGLLLRGVEDDVFHWFLGNTGRAAIAMQSWLRAFMGLSAAWG
jgi:hypothetical protein